MTRRTVGFHVYVTDWGTYRIPRAVLKNAGKLTYTRKGQLDKRTRSARFLAAWATGLDAKHG